MSVETDPANLEQLITDLIAAGANRVSSITFRTSRSRELKDKARVLALRAARLKAEAMAAEYNQKLGAPWKIEDHYPSQTYERAPANLGQGVLIRETGGDKDIVELGTTSFPLGTISIQAYVEVSFELQ